MLETIGMKKFAILKILMMKIRKINRYMYWVKIPQFPKSAEWTKEGKGTKPIFIFCCWMQNTQVL